MGLEPNEIIRKLIAALVHFFRRYSFHYNSTSSHLSPEILVFSRNFYLSMTQAAILAALDYADKAAKESEAADNLRGQIKEYLEDSARYKMEAEVARRDVERLQRELKNAKAKPF